jgi:hypothetical protein
MLAALLAVPAGIGYPLLLSLSPPSRPSLRIQTGRRSLAP